jgi:hypothetical protein
MPSDLTHIIYAFADVNPNSGSVFLTDPYADEQVKLSLSVFICYLQLVPRNTFLVILGKERETTFMVA